MDLSYIDTLKQGYETTVTNNKSNHHHHPCLSYWAPFSLSPCCDIVSFVGKTPGLFGSISRSSPGLWWRCLECPIGHVHTKRKIHIKNSEHQKNPKMSRKGPRTISSVKKVQLRDPVLCWRITTSWFEFYLYLNFPHMSRETSVAGVQASRDPVFCQVIIVIIDSIITL